MNTIDDTLSTVLQVNKALSDLQRVRILMLLRSGELCVCQILEVLGLAPSTVSKHLSVLNAAGLVESRKEGRWMYYRLPAGAKEALVRPVIKWLSETLRDDAVIARDAEILKTLVACDLEELCRRQRGDKLKRPRV